MLEWNGKDITNDKPSIENLCDSTSMEYAVSKQYSELKKKAMKLATLFNTMDIKYIGKLRRGEYEHWQDMIPEILEMSEKAEEIIDEIYELLP